MMLNVQEWKEFNVVRTKEQPGLLVVEQCKCGCAGDLEDGNDICYIGAKKSENGVIKKVKFDDSLVSKGNGIMLICDGQGSVGYSNYMKEDFIGSTTTSIGYDDEINQLRAMFIVTCLDLDRYKYSYGRKYRPSMLKAIVKLPVQRNSDGSLLIDKTKKYSKKGYLPDWQFMETYIKSLYHKPITSKIKKEKTIKLETNEWKEFKINKLFDICAGNYYSSDDYEFGETPYVSAAATNNGVGQMTNLSPDFSENKIVTGKVECKAFYQYKPFCATSDVNIFTPKFDMSQKVGLFLTSIITFNEKGKWSYGRQCRVGDSNGIIIKLPIKHNEDNTPIIDDNRTYSDEGYIPDWQFMEDYINTLSYSDRI